MAGNMKWHGDQIQREIKAELVRRINLCCLLVWNRAKELINVEGTGVVDDSGRIASRKAKIQAKREAKATRAGIAKAYKNTKARHFKNMRAEAHEYNQAHKLGIGLGKIKRLRVTRAGTLSNRGKPKKKKP